MPKILATACSNSLSLSEQTQIHLYSPTWRCWSEGPQNLFECRVLAISFDTNSKHNLDGVPEFHIIRYLGKSDFVRSCYQVEVSETFSQLVPLFLFLTIPYLHLIQYAWFLPTCMSTLFLWEWVLCIVDYAAIYRDPQICMPIIRMWVAAC